MRVHVVLPPLQGGDSSCGFLRGLTPPANLYHPSGTKSRTRYSIIEPVTALSNRLQHYLRCFTVSRDAAHAQFWLTVG
jgi:hypothetical protein